MISFGGNRRLSSSDEKEDLKLSLASMIYFLTQALNLTVKTVLPIPEDRWGMISAFFGVIILFFIFIAWRPLVRRNRELIIKCYVFFSIVCFVSVALISFRGEPLTVLKNPYLLNLFVFWLPTGLCASSVKNKRVLYNVFLRVSYLLAILGFLCFLWGKLGAADENANAYDMQLGFTLIIPTLFFLNEVFKGRYIYLLLFIFQMAIILAYANRGVLLSVVFFVTYKVLFERRHIILSLVTIVSAFLMVAFMEPIAMYLLDLLSNFNLSSRTLSLLIDNSIQESSGRDEIWAICSGMLTEHPITGFGLGGECYTIYTRLSARYVFGYGYSPHNGLLQFLLQFGLIGGGIACALFLYPIWGLHRIKDLSLYNLVLIFFSAVAIPCCYSAGDVFLKPASAVYLFLFYFSFLKPPKTK